MNIFRSKQQHHEDQGDTATMTAEPESAERMTALSEMDKIQRELDRINADRAQLEALASRMSARLMTIDQESAGLKEKLVTGDTTVTETLDRLDADRVQATRKRDGALAAVSTLQAQMVPLQRRARELATQADLERQDAEVVAFEKKAEQLSREIIAGWETACVKSYELVSVIEDAVAGRGLDAEHRSRVLGANERLNGYFLQAGLRVVNEGWPRKESHLFRRLNIQPARPR